MTATEAAIEILIDALDRVWIGCNNDGDYQLKNYAEIYIVHAIGHLVRSVRHGEVR